MAAPQQIDLSAALYSFLLRAYISSFEDARRPPDERMKAQLDLEAFLLSHGPRALQYLQHALNIGEAEPTAEMAAARWFIRFVGSLSEEWLQAVSLGTIERFWRQVLEPATARAAVDLIATVEYVNDPFANAARGSLLVSLFNEVQPEPLTTPLSERADIIVQRLFARATMTRISSINRGQPHIVKYALRVLRYCFKDEYQALTAEELDAVVAHGGDVNDEVRQLLYSQLSY